MDGNANANADIYLTLHSRGHASFAWIQSEMYAIN